MEEENIKIKKISPPSLGLCKRRTRHAHTDGALTGGPRRPPTPLLPASPHSTPSRGRACSRTRGGGGGGGEQRERALLAGAGSMAGALLFLLILLRPFAEETAAAAGTPAPPRSSSFVPQDSSACSHHLSGFWNGTV